ncbi:MAG: hypothetical protein ACJAYU_003162 [Bradymonadia bacterium]|jgi:hypothetical protein
MLVAAIVAPVMIVLLMVLLRNVATTSVLSLGGLFRMSTTLRASVFGMFLVTGVGAYTLASFLRIKGGAALTLETDEIRFVRPGALWTGWFARDVRIPPDRVDRVVVSRQRRVTLERIELAIESGRDTIIVNLGHADGPEQTPKSKLLDRDEWLNQPVLGALEDLTGKEAVRG